MKSKILINEHIINIVTFRYFIIKKIIKKEIKQINNKSILDIGCGTGSLSKLFNDKKYLGFDIDRSLINYAKLKNPKYKYEVEDATKFNFNKKFDYILVVGVIHHLNDIQVKKTLKQLDKHLNKKGKVLMIEAIKPIYKFNIFGRLIREMDRGAYIRTSLEYKKLTSKYFKNIKIKNQLGGFVDYVVIHIEK